MLLDLDKTAKSHLVDLKTILAHSPRLYSFAQICKARWLRPRSEKLCFRRLLAKVIRWGPRFYDFYYRHFAPIQQGSIEGDYPEPSWREDAPHALIFTKRYWLIHTAVESTFAKERQRQGWNVTIVGCDAAIPTCDNMMYYEGELPLTHRCDYCSYMLRRLCERTGVHYLSIREYMDQYELHDRPLPRTRDDYEELTYASWIRLLRSLHPKEPAEFAVHDSLVSSCCILDRFLTHYLDNHRVDQVIMVNGKFFAEQLLAQHCRERGIPHIAYERGTVKETLMFAQGKPAIPADTCQRWKQSKEIPLTDAQREELYTYLDRRKVIGNAELVPFYTDMTEDQAQLCRKYQIDPGKDLVVLFTNSIWDSSVVLEDTVFDNMFDWISTCIEHYRAREDAQLVIRVHPVEVKISKKQETRDRVDDYVQRHFGNLPNVRVIPPEADASPYTLMEMARLGLVYTSSTGLEMALRGKPVIVAGNSHYVGTEFVHTPRSRAHFVSLLTQSPPPRPSQIMYAERYAYMFFFEHMIPYGDLIKQVGADYRFVNDIRDGTILTRAGL